MKHYIKMVHGIRTADGGKKTFSKLKSKINRIVENVDIEIVDYGYIILPISNNRAVNAIIKSIDNEYRPITLVGYSNGCWASVQVAEMGYEIEHLILINPALHKRHAFPEHIKRIDVYYSPYDNIVSLSKWYRKLVNIFPWNWGAGRHDWGEMGRTGYLGSDPRVFNHNIGTVSHFFYELDSSAHTIANDINTLYIGDIKK